MDDLRSVAERDKIIRNRLLSEFGEALSEDEAALLDTLDGISDFKEAVDAALQAMAEADAMAEAIKVRISELSKRSNASIDRSARIRRAITWAMLDANRAKVVCTEATVSVKRGGKAVEIDSLDDLPLDLLRQKDPEPDKKKIKAALEAGREITGARLVDAPATIQVRRV